MRDGRPATGAGTVRGRFAGLSRVLSQAARADLSWLLLAALALRLLVLFAYQRDYPTLHDYFIYYDMAENWLLGKGPVLDFLYNYLHLPAQVVHVEDYYEPLYSLLVAGAMALAGRDYFSALLLPLAASLVAVALVYHGSRRLSDAPPVARAAACLAVIHPLLIERAGSLMKESLIGALYLAFWLAMLRLPASVDVGREPASDPASNPASGPDRALSGQKPGMLAYGAGLGVLAAVIGMLQYESMPILGAATLLTLLSLRHWRAAAAFAAVAGLLMIGYWGWFWLQSGLPVSTKYLFLLTPYSGAPFAGARELGAGSMLAKLLSPGHYIYRSTLAFLGLPLLLIAGRGLWLTRHLAATRWLLWLLPIYLYLHGTAVDLWFQDYLALLLLLFPYAALALVELYRSGGPQLLPALLYGACFWLLTLTELSDRIWYQPLLHSRTLVPLALALALWVLSRRGYAAALARSPRLARASALVLLALLVGEGLRLKPVADLFYEPHGDVFLARRALGEFLQRQLPPTAVVIVADPFSSHFFYQRPTLQLAPAARLKAYAPGYAVGVSREALLQAGYRPEPWLRYAGTPIWRLGPGPQPTAAGQMLY